MQELGTDVLREWKTDIWVNSLERRLTTLLEESTDKTIVVISDCRFPNEIGLVKKHAGKIIRIERCVYKNV